MKREIISVVLSSFFLFGISYETLAQLPGTLTGVRAYTDWADYDNDGDQDLLFSYTQTGTSVTKILTNTAGSFTENANTLTQTFGRVRWGDFDNDGDLDFAQTGSTSGIYRNIGNGNFQLISSTLVNYQGALDWGDYDNDGDLDLVIAGNTSGQWYDEDFIVLYKNNNGSFSQVNNFSPLTYTFNDMKDDIQWIDYDKDGDLDLSFSAFTGTPVRGTFIIRNNGDETFSDPGLVISALGTDWGDYDEDGDMDVVGGINPVNGTFGIVVTNNGGTFASPGIPLPINLGVNPGLVQWGDYDSDGDLDIVACGGPDSSPRPGMLYIQGTTGFSLSNTPFASLKAPVGGGLADYDGDGDLDFILSGVNGYSAD